MKKTNQDSIHATMIRRLAAAGASGAIALGLAACGSGGSGDGGSGDGGEASGDGGSSAGGGAAVENGVALEPEFPKPMFVGTPVKAQLPNLEEPGDPTTSITVPEGTVLVSAGKPVTASDDLPTIGEISFVTDGDKDGGDGYYVELGPDPQWVQIDLEEDFSVEGITMWHFHKNARAYKDVVVMIGSDPEFGEGSYQVVFNSDHDNTLGFGPGKDPAYVETNHGRLFRVPSVTGRYVRLYSNGNTTDDLNHYVEVEVYARPAEG